MRLQIREKNYVFCCNSVIDAKTRFLLQISNYALDQRIEGIFLRSPKACQLLPPCSPVLSGQEGPIKKTFTCRIIKANVVPFYETPPSIFLITNLSSKDFAPCLPEHVTEFRSGSESAPSIDPGCASHIGIVHRIRRRETCIVGKSNFASRNHILRREFPNFKDQVILNFSQISEF